MDPLIAILVCLLSAAIAGEVLSALKVPRVVGQIGAGMLLGIPGIRETVFTQASADLIGHLSSIGVILLLFFTGLEIDFRKFMRNLRVGSNMSLWNTSLPLIGGYLACRYLFGLDPAVSFIVGICLSVTATALALDLLEEFGMLKSRLGALIVSAGAVDDIYELLLITLAISTIEAVAAQSAFAALAINAALFVIAVLLFRALILPAIFRLVEKKTESSLLMSGMIATLLLAALSNYLGFGSLMGALLAGIIVRHTLLRDATHHRPWETHHISKATHTIAFGFLVPIFFVHIGSLTDITAIWDNLGFSAVITVIAIAGTVTGCAIAYRLSAGKWKDGWLVGWALNSKGDTEIVIASLALASGIIGQGIFSSLIFMAVVSTLLSPLVFRHLLEKERRR